MTPGTAVTFGRVLRNRNFLAIWLAQTVSSFGDWLALVALLSLAAFGRRGTPAEVSWVMVAFALPVAVVGPVAGVFVDRWNPKATMIASDLARAVLAALLVIPSALNPVYGIILALSAVSCFFLPAQTTVIPLLVEKDELLVANAANTQTFYLNKIIGPAVAGLLVARFGENICFLLDSFSFVFSAMLLACVTVPRAWDRPPGLPVKRTVPRSVASELTEGFRFMASHSLILFLTVSVMAAIFAVSFFDALAAVFVRDVLAGSSRLFGVLVSLVGAGTIAAAWAIGRFGQHRSKSLTIALGILLMGTSILVLSLWSRPAVVLSCALVFGMGTACIVVSAQTLLQEETPHEILGRATSAIYSLVTMAQVAGFLMAGFVAHWVGILRIYQLAGLAMLGAAGFAFMSTRRPAASRTARA